MYANEDRLILIHVGQILFKPVELLLRNGATVIISAMNTAVKYVIEGHNMPIANVARIISRAESIAIFLVRLGVVLHLFVVVVVAYD